jgi:hypothetical protein
LASNLIEEKKGLKAQDKKISSRMKNMGELIREDNE